MELLTADRVRRCLAEHEMEKEFPQTYKHPKAELTTTVKRALEREVDAVREHVMELWDFNKERVFDVKEWMRSGGNGDIAALRKDIDSWT